MKKFRFLSLLVWAGLSSGPWLNGQDTRPATNFSWKVADRPVREVGPPRKIVVATVIRPFWEKVSLDELLDVICALIDEAAEQAARDYPGRGLDLVVLPEGAVSLAGASAELKSVELKGNVADRIGAKARQYNAYLVVPMFLSEEDDGRHWYSNAAVLFDRRGAIEGIYRKVHPVADLDSDLLEGGVTPGNQFPVFECDFGRMGIQICWDLSYEEGWRSLAGQGAELVVLPTESPQLTKPAYYASRGRYWVISSCPRHNASIFNPAGMIDAQILEGSARVLVHRIDLASLVLPWSARLENGQALSREFGDRVGFRYSAAEDAGVFWSNDRSISISHMVRRLGLVEFDWRIERTRRLQDGARKAP